MQMIFGLFSCRASSICLSYCCHQSILPFLILKFLTSHYCAKELTALQKPLILSKQKQEIIETISLSLCNDCVCKFRNEKICHSQEYYIYTHLYKSLSLSKHIQYKGVYVMSSAASSDSNSGRNRILVSVYQMREQYIHIIQFNIDSRSRSRSDDRSQCNMQIENTSSIYDSVFADGDGFVNLCAWGRAKK